MHQDAGLEALSSAPTAYIACTSCLYNDMQGPYGRVYDLRVLRRLDINQCPKDRTPAAGPGARQRHTTCRTTTSSHHHQTTTNWRSIWSGTLPRAGAVGCTKHQWRSRNPSMSGVLRAKCHVSLRPLYSVLHTPDSAVRTPRIGLVFVSHAAGVSPEPTDLTGLALSSPRGNTTRRNTAHHN